MVLKESGFLRRHLLAAVTLAGIGLIALAAWVYTGLYDIAADQPHWGVTSKLITTLRDRSINTRAEKIVIPGNLSDAGLVKRGAAQFAAMCSSCHTGPGEQPSDLNEGLYPKPPDFGKVRIEPARAFWIIKHGVKMSGMPAWGGSHDDDLIWAMVGFLQKMPQTTPAQYKDLTKDAPTDHMEPKGNASSPGMDMGTMAPMAN